MCTKKWVGGLAALVALVVLGTGFGATEPGQKFYGWVGVQVQKVFGAAGDQVTLEDQIKMLDNEVNDLDKDILKEYSAIAKHRREMDKLDKDIVTHRQNLLKQEQALDDLHKSLTSTSASNGDLVINGDKKSVQDWEADFTSRWKSFKKGQEGLAEKEALLEQSQGVLNTMNDNWEKLGTLKEDLKRKLKKLENEHKSAQLAKAQKEAGAVSDEMNKKLERINKWMGEVETKIEEEKDLVKLNGTRPVGNKNTGIDAGVESKNAKDEFSKFKKAKDEVIKTSSDQK